MRLIRLAGVGLVFAVALSFGCRAEPQSKAPNFALKTQQGETLELKKLKGKVVVLNFWATWCAPCRAEIPGMLEVYDKYKAKGLEIVGVSLDRGGWTRVTPFLEKMRITYPVVIGDVDLVNLYGGIEAIPTTFIIDKKGNIARKHIGYLSKNQFEEQIRGLL